MHELLPWTFHDALPTDRRHLCLDLETFKASKLFDEMLKRHVVPQKPQSGWTHLTYDGCLGSFLSGENGVSTAGHSTSEEHIS